VGDAAQDDVMGALDGDDLPLQRLPRLLLPTQGDFQDPVFVQRLA